MTSSAAVSRHVPLLDLDAQMRAIRPEIDKAVSAVLDENSYILGPQVKEFEERVAEYSECQGAVGVASGTDALLLALKAAGVGANDEVITSPYTFFATAGAIHNAGAKPVFVDVEADSFNLDMSLVKPKISPRTRALIPVHLFGQCADLGPLLAMCRDRQIAMIEDAAQAIGSRQKIHGRERTAGSVGLGGCLSFFPSKNLGGIGDAGMVVSNDEDFLQKVRILRVHGSHPKYYHHTVGYNSRLDTIQAAVLLVKLQYLPQWTEQRRSNADRYRALFEHYDLQSEVRLPQVGENNFHIYNQFVIQVSSRDELQGFLGERGISTAVYYPVPLHLQKCFQYLGHREGDFPVSERLARTSLALPIYPELTEEQQDYVVRMIGEFYEKSGSRVSG